ncbi:hypothetical protein [Brevundimonas faecalis]|uniref:Uncharacterized protein n=1 Tax=Brevundimonas faecalis TaxID=947378 RepID=A0ABV2R7U2_9CAUL
MLKTLSGLIRLGSAAVQTRAEIGTEKAELNPVYRYDDLGARADILRLGGAEQRTRADSPDGRFELIPVQRWEMNGAAR